MQPLYHSTDLEQTDRIKTVFKSLSPMGDGRGVLGCAQATVGYNRKTIPQEHVTISVMKALPRP